MASQNSNAVSPAQRKATEKYISAKYDSVTLRVPKGNKKSIQDHAEKCGESLNTFINRAISETIARDNSSK